MSTLPQDFGLDHSSWRPQQQETLEWALELAANRLTGILEAPTGSGKTSFAKGVASQYRTVALVKTKALQRSNYSDKYAFDILYGKRNYECVHEEAEAGANATHCLFAGKMNKCPVADQCPYLQAKALAMDSDVLSLNYSYWLASPHMRRREIDCLVLDEAHQLSEVVLDHVGLMISLDKLAKWDLPHWPRLTSLTIGVEKSQHVIASEWLNRCAAHLESEMERLRGRDGKIENLRRYDSASNLKDSFEATADALIVSEDEWHIRVSDDGEELTLKPLTARHHFKHLFLNGHATLAMSGTIGNMDVFAAELGIRNPQTRRVEPQWPASQRPVYLLDAPRMKFGNSRGEFDKQAQVIAGAINDHPREWTGLILVTSKDESRKLADRLVRCGLDEDRIFIPNLLGDTEDNLADWLEFRKWTPGALCVSWGMWEGVDLTDDRICIVAKVPYINTVTDAYEAQRMNTYRKFNDQRVAWKLEQGLGRTRRGETSDYDTSGKREQLVAIADGNYSRVKSYLSPAMQESLVSYP